MSDHLTEDDVIAAVPGLTRSRLCAFVETKLVIPMHRQDQGDTLYIFRRVDCARVQLLCDLTDDLDVDGAALGIVITLIDKLHVARQDLIAIARALDAEPPDIRARIGAAMIGGHGR